MTDFKDNSIFWKWYIHFLERENIANSSYYALAMGRIDESLLRFGNVVKKSMFYRMMIWIRGFYEQITAGSVIFGMIHRLSLHQWVLVAFAFYLPLEYLVRDFLSIGALASVWEELFLFIAALMIVWRKILGQSEAIGRQTPLDGFIILFMAVGLLLMSAVEPNPAVALAGYRAVVEYMLWFFLMIRLIEDDKDFRVIHSSFLILGAILCLHGIYQFIVAVPIPASWVTQTEMGVRTRVFSLTGSPNIFGSLIVLLAPLAASMIYYSKKGFHKIFFFLTTGLMSLALLFTFSRGAWVGMAVAVILFSLYLDRRLLGLMGAVMAGVLAFVPSITSRLTYLFTSDYAEASSIGGRSLRWATGKMLLSENNPWLGFGLGRFGGAVAMNNKLLDETEEFHYFYMDNYYLKTMVEMGYIGIIFFLLLLAALMVFGLRAIYRSGIQGDASTMKSKDPLWRAVGDPKALAIGIFSGMVGVLVHCYFENIFEEPYMMAYFWGLAAMLLYLGYFRTAGQRLPSR